MAFKVAVIIVCAGRGRRLKKNIDKAFAKIGRVPLFCYSYKAFRRVKDVSQIIVVARRKYFGLVRHYLKGQYFSLVEGGRRRQDSVYNGIKALDESISYVLIHDGARPFIKKQKIIRLIRHLAKYPAVTLGLPVKEALKLVRKGVIKKTMERKDLYAIQTPQGFKKKILLQAYNRIKKKDIYDETHLLEMLGKRIKVIEGDLLNIKITYPEDLELAEAILAQEKKGF